MTTEQTDGRERRRYERLERRISVTFTLEGQEYAAHTVDISKTGALFAAKEVPQVDTRLLLNLSDRQNPDLTLFLKANVVRCDDDGGDRQFAVEFGDVIARDPKRLRMFLERALSIETGLIRVVGGEHGEEKAYAFSFESVHREGEERVKALQASLFSSFKEMEEADMILSNFGRSPTGDGLSKSSSASGGVKITRVEGGEQAGKEGPGEAVEAKSPKAKKEKEAKKGKQGKKKKPAREAKEKGEGKKTSLFSRLAGIFGKGGDGQSTPKGETLIQTQRLPTVVAKNASLPIVYKVGNSRHQATATRLYCAGMKCLTEHQLPQLYASVTILVPLAGAKKFSQIELTGDVTRVRGEDEDSTTGGIFEIRLSMRTDRTHLDLYRALIEKLIGETSPPEG